MNIKKCKFNSPEWTRVWNRKTIPSSVKIGALLFINVYPVDHPSDLIGQQLGCSQVFLSYLKPQIKVI